MYFNHRKLNISEILKNEFNMVTIRPNIIDSNIYIIGTTLIDAGTGLNKENYIKEFHKNNLSLNDISRIILTHEHYDHVGGTKLFKKSKVLAHKNTSELFFKDHPLTLYEYYKSLLPRKKADIELKNNDKIRISGLDFKIIHTPEHSKGSICLYNEKLGILFSGDLIPKKEHISYNLIINKKQLIQKLTEINKLHINVIYPGHGKPIENGNQYLNETINKLREIRD